MKRCSAWLLALALAPMPAQAVDNEFVRITRDAAPCAAAGTPGCGARVFVALSECELQSGGAVRTLERGDVAVFGAGDSYVAPLSGSYFEVAIKPDHPASASPAEIIAPASARRSPTRSEERLVGEERTSRGTRSRHKNSQRVVIQLNAAKLRQWPDGKPVLELETAVDRAGFSPPVIHVVENIGQVPLRGVIIEFRPGVPGPARR